MQQRLDPFATAPATIQLLRNVEGHLRKCGLEESLIHLVKMRASQINGCAFCLDMHSHDARLHGETEQRLHVLNGWEETSSLYTPRERAALRWTEALTRIADTHAPDADYEEARRHFTEEELVNLTTVIGMINLWNRLAIGFRAQVPAREPASRAA